MISFFFLFFYNFYFNFYFNDFYFNYINILNKNLYNIYIFGFFLYTYYFLPFLFCGLSLYVATIASVLIVFSFNFKTYKFQYEYIQFYMNYKNRIKLY